MHDFGSLSIIMRHLHISTESTVLALALVWIRVITKGERSTPYSMLPERPQTHNPSH
jgi:hypothetical protein